MKAKSGAYRRLVPGINNHRVSDLPLIILHAEHPVNIGAAHDARPEEVLLDILLRAISAAIGCVAIIRIN
ncbi:MAG: hypothetical protein WDZ52_08805 [Pseudohongiellaceae bacterium]